MIVTFCLRLAFGMIAPLVLLPASVVPPRFFRVLAAHGHADFAELRNRAPEMRHAAATAGFRRRFAPHQLRHAHAVEMAHEGVSLVVIQRQLGHSNLGITSIYLQGIDNAEIIDTVHARRAPMVPAHTTRYARGSRCEHAGRAVRPSSTVSSDRFE